MENDHLKQKHRKLKRKIKYWIKSTIAFILNPRLLLCFGIAWLITNGWAYIALGFSTWLGINWLATISGAYLTFLWIPVTPEKILTIIIAIFLLKLLFPNDKKTLKKLQRMKEKVKETTKKVKDNYKTKHNKENNLNNNKNTAKKYIKEIIILSIQLLYFYFFPLLITYYDAMGIVLVMLFITVVLSLILGAISKNKIKFLYPIAIAILFLPTVPIYYNESALIYSLWYLIFSTPSLLFSSAIRQIIIKISNKSKSAK